MRKTNKTLFILAIAGFAVFAVAATAVSVEYLRYMDANYQTFNALGSANWWIYPSFIAISMIAVTCYSLYRIVLMIILGGKKSAEEKK